MKLIEKIKWLNKGIALGEKCRNLTDAPVGEGTSIYCGDYDYVTFLLHALGELGVEGEFDTYTVDGEWHVEVKLHD